MNSEIIAWDESEELLTFWKLFCIQAFFSLKLPFRVGSTHSQLTNRNLLVLQNERSKELVFIDVIQKRVVFTSQVEHRLCHSINSENKVFTLLEGVLLPRYVHRYSEECLYCYKVSSFHTQQVPRSLNVGNKDDGSKVIFLDGAKIFLRQTLWSSQIWGITDDQLIIYDVNRYEYEPYSGFLSLSNTKNAFLLMARYGHIAIIQFRQLHWSSSITSSFDLLKAS